MGSTRRSTTLRHGAFSCIFMYNSYMVSDSYSICWLLLMLAKWFIGFSDGASHHTCNLASAMWVIYSPSGHLVTSGGAFLGNATNNVAEYRGVVQLLWDSSLCGITRLEVRLDSQLVVSHLNGAYQVRNPTLLRLFLQVRLLEINLDYISFNHIPRSENTITDAYANYILHWHLTHIL